MQKSSYTWPLLRWPPGKNQGGTRLLSQSQDLSPVLSGTSIWAQYGMLERQPWWQKTLGSRPLYTWGSARWRRGSWTCRGPSGTCSLPPLSYRGTDLWEIDFWSKQSLNYLTLAFLPSWQIHGRAPADILPHHSFGFQPAPPPPPRHLRQNRFPEESESECEEEGGNLFPEKSETSLLQHKHQILHHLPLINWITSRGSWNEGLWLRNKKERWHPKIATACTTRSKLNVKVKMGMKVKVYKKKEGSTLMWDGMRLLALS